MSKIDSWITKIPRLKNSKVARFSYKAEAYANDDIEGVENYDYSRDMNVPLATHTDFDSSMLSIGARANFSSIPKNGLNHFFGRVSYNLNKVIDFLSDFLDDFRVQGIETLRKAANFTLETYADGKKLRIANTHAANTITCTLPSGQTMNGNGTISIPAGRIIDIELIGSTWKDNLTGNLVGNADTATAIKPLGNSITLEATPTFVTKIVKIATVSWGFSGTINIGGSGRGIVDEVKVHIGKIPSVPGTRVIYSKNSVSTGIKKIIVTCAMETLDTDRNIYAEIVTCPNYWSTTTLGIVETNDGTFTPSMTEVSSIEGTVVDSLSLDYHRGDISSYQHVFTKDIIGNLTGNASKANVRVSLRHGNTWFNKTWTGLTDFFGSFVWTDGDNIYYSEGTNRFVLNKATSTWTAKTWTGLTNFDGYNIWTDGENIYFSSGTTQYVLNKSTSTWTAKTWTGLTNFYGDNIWTDGDNIYYSYGTNDYVLPTTRHNYVDDDKYNSLFGIVTNCNCSTLSARFVFGNE